MESEDGIIDVGDARDSILENVPEEFDLINTPVRQWSKQWVTLEGTRLRVLKWVPGTDKAEYADLSKIRREQTAFNKRLLNDRAPVTRSISTVLRKRTLRSNDPERFSFVLTCSNYKKPKYLDDDEDLEAEI